MYLWGGEWGSLHSGTSLSGLAVDPLGKALEAHKTGDTSSSAPEALQSQEAEARYRFLSGIVFGIN